MPEVRQAHGAANRQSWPERWLAVLGLHRLPRLQRGGAGVKDRSDRIIALKITILDICLGLQCQVNTKQSCPFPVIASHPDSSGHDTAHGH